jgi:glutaredoxin
MKRALVLFMLLCAGAANAQMYKWKDARGVTHYSDTPPPPGAAAATRPVELKSFTTGGAVELPPELAAAVRDRPVTLYTTGQCAACDQARGMLQARGIPYSEKTVSSVDDHAALKRAGSSGQLPLLLIGRMRQIGFEQATWDALLSDAGYPEQRMLPANYSYPAPSPAAPASQPSETDRSRAAAKAAEEQAQREQRLPPVNAPPDFQF